MTSVPLAALVVGINLSLGILLLLRARHNPAARIFAITVFSIVVWSFSVFSETPEISNDLALFYSRLAFFSGSFIATSFLYFSFVFPRPTQGISLVKKIVIWGIGVFFALISLSSLVIASEQLRSWGWEGTRGPLSRAFDIYFIVFMFAALIVLIRKFLNAKGIARIQIEYFLIGSLISVIGGTTTNVIIPFFTTSSFTGYYGPYFSVFYVIFTTYAILRHRFLDIRIVLRKGTVYAVTIAIVLGVYGYLVFVISQTTSNIFKIGGDITSVAIIILIALGFHPLRKMVEHTLNEYIFPKRVDLRAVAKRITIQLSSSITEIEKVIKTIRNEANPALNTESIDLFFQKDPGIWDAVQPVSNTKISVDPKDPLFQRLSQKANIIIAEELEYPINDATDPDEIKSLQEVRKILLSNGAAAVVPIIQHPDTLIGILFLGPKANQSAYTVEDVQFLKNLQQNLSLSMGGIILYYQAMKRVHDQIKK